MELLTEAYLNIFQNQLKGFVFKKVRNKAVAEDIIHDVFLKAQKNSSQLKDPKKASAWLYQITRNAIIDHYRISSKAIEVTDMDWQNEEQNYNTCAAKCLQELLPSLPEKYRIPLQLADLENLSQLELAQRLGISYSGAKTRVQRARKMLKDKLNENVSIETDAYGNVIVCENRSNCCKRS